MNSTPSIRWLVALRAEAKEIISQYELKSFEHEGPYQIFKSKKYDIWLIISGIGNVNAAAASAYLFLKSFHSISIFRLISFNPGRGNSGFKNLMGSPP